MYTTSCNTISGGEVEIQRLRRNLLFSSNDNEQVKTFALKQWNTGEEITLMRFCSACDCKIGDHAREDISGSSGRPAALTARGTANFASPASQEHLKMRSPSFSGATVSNSTVEIPGKPCSAKETWIFPVLWWAFPHAAQDPLGCCEGRGPGRDPQEAVKAPEKLSVSPLNYA